MHRYRDPDAEHRADWDGPPVEQRAERRFQKRFLSKGIAAAANGKDDPPPAIEENRENGVIAIPDLTPTELEDGHVPLREALVNHFHHLWRKKKVQWLKYPNRRKLNF